ncbi:hypothetical protein EST38_g964 [Candolleomyces aberdarensis]|uniref:hydroxyacylglutathione hydrolase n=1 Tax=Candolleomyces aberdarensis TaxID=2316362 RepID=A0A4Q2DYF5_9AGAR|nr:hypothetical protein EST38_g964 [Candolleomyces aberdarensis]
MKIVPVPVREDNYAYLLIDEPSKKAAAVDIYDVDKVVSKANELGVNITAAFTTHRHNDHSGGNKTFASQFPDAPIYGGSDQIPALTQLVKDKDEFTFGDNIRVKCLATPCHTRESICYHVTDEVNKDHPGAVFTGDTLFIAGCGRFLDGTGEQMIAALGYLGTLPDDTTVYNGHEYTAASAAFGKHVDPDNPAIARLEGIIEKNSQTTGLTTIGDEKQWNVFMRLDTEPVRKATDSTSETPQSQVMDALREKKNAFKG